MQRTPPDSPDLPSRLNNLGTGLRDRYARSGQLADLEEAIGRWQEAVQRTPPDSPDLPSRLNNLGNGLSDRYARTGDLFAAAIALEQGQARGLNDRLARDEANLLQVRQQAPTLFQQYQEAAARLRQLEAAERQARLATTGETTRPADWAAQSGWAAHRQQVQQARTDLQTAVAAIRQLDGYERFLLPPRFEEIATAVHAGHPLAYLVTTPVGSLALLLHRPAPTAELLIEPLWADAFTTDDLNAFLIKRENGQVQGGYLPGQFFGGTLLRPALAEGLPRLGETLLVPLAHRLHALGLQRITLIPGGRLNLLPLHAAALTLNNQASNQQTPQPTIFGDAFTVSYAPSARALAASRRRLEKQTDQPPTLLVVGNPLPLPDDIRPLRYARPEAEEIALRFGGTPHLYCETAATHAAISAAMPAVTYLHFACHGEFDPEQPLQSGLVLSGGERLTLRQVLDDLPLDAARLVTLSACQMAISDFGDLPDEVIGLPAGFLQAGAAGVLGSLWPVDDLSTALFMDHFYQLHRGAGVPRGWNRRPPCKPPSAGCAASASPR